jgi:uncharacterized protein with beta-barrel porin domain
VFKDLMNKEISKKKFLAMAGIGVLAIPFLAKNVLGDYIFRNETNSYGLGELVNTGQVKITGVDSTSGYLSDKLVAGLNASLTITNPGSSETLTVKGKAEVQDAEPSTPHTGAIWYDSDDSQGTTGNLTATSPINVTGGTNAVNGAGAAINISSPQKAILSLKSVSANSPRVKINPGL